MRSDKASKKTILITGGGSGIGLETARQLLADPQYQVVLIGREQGKLDDAARELGADRATAFACDLRDLGAIQRTMVKILAVHKNIHGLVNNAGVYPFGGALTTDEKSWDEAFAVNLKAPFFLIQQVVPAMVKNADGGRIVNVSSTAGLLPNHFALAYSVSKAAMIQMTKTLAKELGKDNITVNCVCPGIVRTPLHEAYHASKTELEDFYARRGATFPLGRVGEPKDVAGAICFFLSDQSAWVTGDTLVVDGGRLLL